MWFPDYSDERFNHLISKANKLISDEDDTEYLATSLALNKTPLWSEDKHFKETKVTELVNVFNTKELVDYLKSREFDFTN